MSSHWIWYTYVPLWMNYSKFNNPVASHRAPSGISFCPIFWSMARCMHIPISLSCTLHFVLDSLKREREHCATKVSSQNWTRDIAWYASQLAGVWEGLRRQQCLNTNFNNLKTKLQFCLLFSFSFVFEMERCDAGVEQDADLALNSLHTAHASSLNLCTCDSRWAASTFHILCVPVFCLFALASL